MPPIKSEDDILALLDGYFPRRHASLLLGRGDDCAELVSPSPLALSTDLFLEDVHFRRSYFFPEEIGHKALAVNLSDLAAAGAVPLGFSLGLICPRGLDGEWLARVFKGMGELAELADIPLSGGDISVPSGNVGGNPAGSAGLGFSVTVWGRSAVSGSSRPFLRRGAEAGDFIFVVGPRGAGAANYLPLGLARLGLELLERRGRPAAAGYPVACNALLRPIPLLEAGIFLSRLASEQGRAEGGGAGISLMDVSDGLLKDLPRLLSGKKRNFQAFDESAPEPPGAELDFELSVLHGELLGQPDRGFSLAVFGGDEYALLGACSPECAGKLREHTAGKDLPFTLNFIGRAVKKSGIYWQDEELTDIVRGKGFDHFNV